jgi:hypothetical protein
MAKNTARKEVNAEKCILMKTLGLVNGAFTEGKTTGWPAF